MWSALGPACAPPPPKKNQFAVEKTCLVSRQQPLWLWPWLRLWLFGPVQITPRTFVCTTCARIPLQHVFGRPREPGLPAFLDPGQAPEGSVERSGGHDAKVPAPRILVREDCRERWGEYVCDGRRSIAEIIHEFPGFDFSEMQYDEVVLPLAPALGPPAPCTQGVAYFARLPESPTPTPTPNTPQRRGRVCARCAVFVNRKYRDLMSSLTPLWVLTRFIGYGQMGMPGEEMTTTIGCV